MSIPVFRGLDPASAGLLVEVAARWLDNPRRPQADPEVLRRWDQLVAAWCDDPTLPLLVRRAATKGTVTHHEASGRELLHVDNSPANWSLASALLGRCPALDKILPSLKAGTIPIGMIKLATAGPYPGLLRANMDPPNLNTLGWKVCHIEPVGTNDRTPATRLPLDTLKDHTWRLLRPANMFLVPKLYVGLGELPEVITAFRAQLKEWGNMSWLEKFAWKEGDVVITKGDWTLGVNFDDGSTGLVQSWDYLQQYLLQNDAGASVDMKNAFYRFMLHNPMAKFMPSKLRAELQAEGLLSGEPTSKE